MKETGVIRRIDELGRIVIPKEIRKRLRVGPGDMLDIYTEGQAVILEKYSMIDEYQNQLGHLLNALKTNKTDFIVCSTSNVIASTIAEIDEGAYLEPGFLNLFTKVQDLELPASTTLEICKGYSPNKMILARRIYHYGNIAAHIIMLSDNAMMKSEHEAFNILERYIKNSIEEIE